MPPFSNGNVNQERLYSFADAESYLGGKDLRVLGGKATNLVRQGEDKIAVTYWDTAIVVFHRNGDIQLFTGGFNTVTTRLKISGYLKYGWGMSSKRGIQYVCWPSVGHDHLFAEGMILHPDGTVSGEGQAADKAAQTKLRNRIKKYAKAYTAALAAGEVGQPGGAGCFYCSPSMSQKISTAHVENDKLVVEPGFDEKPHLLSHIDESYFVPDLLWNAMRSVPTSVYTRTCVAIAMKMDIGLKDNRHTLHEREIEWLNRDVPKIIAKYLYKELGLA